MYSSRGLATCSDISRALLPGATATTMPCLMVKSGNSFLRICGRL